MPNNDKPARRRVRTVEEDFTRPGPGDGEPGAVPGPHEIADIRDADNFGGELKEFLQEQKGAGGGEIEYVAKLYKYDPKYPTKQMLMEKRRNDILDADSIGMQYGSGEYRCLVCFPDNPKIPPKAFKINIHPVYDERRRKAGLDLGGSPQVPQVDQLAMFRSFVEILKPVFDRQAAPAGPTPEGMIQQSQMLSVVLDNQLKKQMEWQDRLLAGREKEARTRYREYGPDQGGDADDEGGSIMWRTFIPLLEKYLPVILGGGIKSEITMDMIKASPVFKDLIRNKQELTAAIALLRQTCGQANADAALKKMGVRVPPVPSGR